MLIRDSQIWQKIKVSKKFKLKKLVRKPYSGQVPQNSLSREI